MRLITFIILGAALGPTKSDADSNGWAYVPADRDARSFLVFPMPNFPDESIVRFVGTGPIADKQQPDQRRVFAIALTGDSEVEANSPSDEDLTGRAVPPGARWPDAHGRIDAGPTERGGESMAPTSRNPWDVRPMPKAAGIEIVFDCGGIITGGEGGSVGILNGRIVRRGDALGEFNVAAVFANGVLLERSGSLFVIPKGRRVTATITDG